jgi:hypothetical protein
LAWSVERWRQESLDKEGAEGELEGSDGTKGVGEGGLEMSDDLCDTEQQTRASFGREGGASWAIGRGLVRAARTEIAAHRAVIFAWSGRQARM